MQEIFIEVSKVIEKTKDKKKTDDGTEIVNPIDRRGIIESDIQIHTESITISTIRSFRHWEKSRKQEEGVYGPMTIIYFHGEKDDKKDKPAQMLIAEDYNSFADRLKTIRVGKDEKGN